MSNTPSPLRGTPPTSWGRESSPPASLGEYGEAGREYQNKLHSVEATGTLNNKPIIWALPEEVPVAILINSKSYAVMMATPADLEDFAIGFTLSEGLVKHASDIANVLTFPSGDGFTADVSVAEEKLIRERMVSRTLEGRVGCGLCGIEEMKDAIRMPSGKAVSYTHLTLPTIYSV